MVMKIEAVWAVGVVLAAVLPAVLVPLMQPLPHAGNLLLGRGAILVEPVEEASAL